MKKLLLNLSSTLQQIQDFSKNSATNNSLNILGWQVLVSTFQVFNKTSDPFCFNNSLIWFFQGKVNGNGMGNYKMIE